MYCEDCQFEWEAAEFPMDVETLEQLTKSRCVICHGENISVFEASVEDPNVQES